MSKAKEKDKDLDKSKKKKSKKKKAIIIVIIIILIAFACAGGYYCYKNLNKKDNSTKEEKKSKYEDEIKKYGYTLEKRDTDLFREKFKELKKVLTGDKVDFKKYAELLSELYIIDLYTIDNKDSTYDIGGTEYIYPDALENYETKVKDTIYKYVKDNSDGKREQTLPEVSEIKVQNVEETTYKVGEKEYPAYKVKLTFDYKNDLNYDTKATVTSIKDNDKLYIVEEDNGELESN